MRHNILKASSMSSTVSDISLSTSRQSPQSKFFDWDDAKFRLNSEYVDKNFAVPHNKIAEELKHIGGLGEIKCVRKKRVGTLINRPTQVQKICHTTTKLLPNFSRTEQLRPVACSSKQQINIDGCVERVKVAENQPFITSNYENGEALKSTKSLFNHHNPLYLDLNALSMYQNHKSNAERRQRQKNFQIIRRLMETKELTSEGVERIMQQNRDEKFKFPDLFKVFPEEMGTGTASTVVEDMNENCCKEVPTLDKSKNKRIVHEHLQHKEDKLRHRLNVEREKSYEASKEMEMKRRELQENHIFSLAYESYSESECNEEEKSKLYYSANASNFDTHKKSAQQRINAKELELLANEMRDKDEIMCGEKIERKVILRSFHDRYCSEPRGKINSFNENEIQYPTCMTHQQWLNHLSNDPKFNKQPPQGKLLSSLRNSFNPNDDKTVIFQTNVNEKVLTSESCIKNYIRASEQKLKQRMERKNGAKAQKVDVNLRRLQRMRYMYMGIPTAVARTSRAKSTSEIKSIVESLSQHRMSPDDVKLKPKIPTLMNVPCNKDNELAEILPFKNAQPRGNDPKMLRVDKSMPWIESEINITREKLKATHEENEKSSEVREMEGDIAGIKEEERKENSCGVRKVYRDIILSKHQFHNNNAVTDDCTDAEECSKIEEQQSGSTLSSEGTYFSNDSGSYLNLLDKSIPKSALRIGTKAENKSMITIKEAPTLENEPFFMGDKNTMIRLCKPQDRFHTQRTRSCANVRERVKVESPEYKDELIGCGSFKMPFKLATDIDEFYIKEFHHERSRAELKFKRISEIIKLRKTLMQKIDIYYMKEQLMDEKLKSIREERIVKCMENLVQSYSKFLDDLKVTKYRLTLRKMQEVKNYYAVTAQLREKHEHFRTLIEPVQMKILHHSIDFMKRNILQNFLFLNMPQEWREQNDHLHRDSNGNLESWEISIRERENKNVWNRDATSTNEIMNYINSSYSNSYITMKSDDFFGAYQMLQTKSLKAVKKITFITMVLPNLENEMRKSLKSHEMLVCENEKIKTSFIERMNLIDRKIDTLQERVSDILYKRTKPAKITQSLFKITALIETLFVDKISAGGRIKFDLKIEDKLFLIEKKVLDCLTALDGISQNLIVETENKIRMEKKKKFRIAERAYKIEQNIDKTMSQLQKLLAKPQKKDKPVKKMQQTFIKKKIKVKPADSAFNLIESESRNILGGDVKELKSDENVKRLIEKIKNESIPFHFDHFLKTHNFKMQTLTDEQAESIIKSEVGAKFKEILPAVKKRVQTWELINERKKMRDVLKTPYFYE